MTDSAPAELHRRADTERPPHWHAQIDQWLDTGGAPQYAKAELAPRPSTRW
jgi:hypothetical protein